MSRTEAAPEGVAIRGALRASPDHRLDLQPQQPTEPDRMTALRLPRPRAVRPLAILGASVLLVAATQASVLLRPGSSTPEALAPADRPMLDLGVLPAAGAPAGSAADGLARIDRAIEAWRSNLAANDRDFLSAANVARLYETRAALSGDVTDYGRAIEAANRSLAIEAQQLDVRALHARLLLAIHDFQRALAEAESLDRTAPDQPAILAIIGDARLEMGEVDAAEALFARIQALAPGPAVTARIARVALVRGDAAAAANLAEVAFDAAEEEGLQGPALSWYAFYAGVMALESGAPASAGDWFDRALLAWPENRDAIAGHAGLAAAEGDLEAAVDGYRAAIALAPEPDLRIALGDVLALRGDVAAAAAEYEAARASLRVRVEGRLVFSRQLAMFEIDHGGDPELALRLAETDLLTRRDVDAVDLHAWALLANGRPAEADAAARQALAMAPRDATVLFHAGVIAGAVGDAGRARDLLEAALAIDGALDLFDAERAGAALERLR